MSTTARERPDVLETTTADRAPASATAKQSWSTVCLNCGTDLTGPFCRECGQRAVPPHPTLRELGGEAFAELSGWDGKLAETIRSLVRHPGKLTVDFLAGFRVRYISPLRLYLTCSLVYFIVAAAAPGTRNVVRITPGSVAAAGTIQPRNIVGAADDPNLTAEDRAAIQMKLETTPAVLRPMLRRVMADSRAFQTDLLAAMPKVLFALLPVFAGILMLFYPRRHFTEHLYFALHVHAFAFVALAVSQLPKFAHSTALIALGGILVLVWVPVYGHLALRRVYGGSQIATFLKEIGICALYCAVSLPALVGMTIWISWR